MRLTQKKIEGIFISILGEEGLILLDKLYGKENVSEFDLATETKKDIKVIRKMLYLLYNNNLVSFIRKKDKQKGWYIYYWTILPESIKFIYIKNKKNLLKKLQTKLEEENKELFFICPNDCARLNFDQAMDFEFHCPECGELITQDNTEEKKELIQKKIKEIEEELELIKKEQKRQKVRIIKARKEAEKKEKARELAEEKKKIKKKTVPKKAVKKKTTTKKVVKKKVPPKKEEKKLIKKIITKKKVVKKKEKVITKKKATRKKTATPKKEVKKKTIKSKVPKKSKVTKK